MFVLVLKAALTVAVLTVAAFGAGSWISPRLSPAYSKLDRLALSWLGGIGLLSLSIFIVGQWRFSPDAVGAVCLIALLFAVRPSFRLTKEIRNSYRERRILKAPALVVLPILFMIGFSSLAEI